MGLIESLWNKKGLPGQAPTAEDLASWCLEKRERLPLGLSKQRIPGSDRSPAPVQTAAMRMLALAAPVDVYAPGHRSWDVATALAGAMMDGEDLAGPLGDAATAWNAAFKFMKDMGQDTDLDDVPLISLLKAYAACPKAIEAVQWRHGILPAPFAVRLHRRHAEQGELPGFGQFQRPERVLPGERTQAYLPTLEPETQPTPALILSLLDEGGGAVGKGPAPVANRLFVFSLLSVPPKDRTDSLRSLTMSVEEIIEGWLGWNPKRYWPNEKVSGKELQLSLAKMSRISVPLGDRGGLYYPVMFGGASGWELSDRIRLICQLPTSEVGPPVDRWALKKLGKIGNLMFRSYLSVVFDWDRYGGRHGKLVRPTRPEVHRAPGGQVVDRRGQVLLDRQGRPVLSPHNPRAVKTGRREPNPARTRYPEYGPDDRVALAYPAGVFKDRRLRSKARKVAERAFTQIEDMGVWVIERDDKFWRVMPPDRNPDFPQR